MRRYAGASSAVTPGGGVEARALTNLDPSRGQAELTFKNCKAEPLGAAGEGWTVLTQVLGTQIDHVITDASHFLQEDAGPQIGRLIADWLG